MPKKIRYNNMLIENYVQGSAESAPEGGDDTIYFKGLTFVGTGKQNTPLEVAIDRQDKVITDIDAKVEPMFDMEDNYATRTATENFIDLATQVANSNTGTPTAIVPGQSRLLLGYDTIYPQEKMLFRLDAYSEMLFGFNFKNEDMDAYAPQQISEWVTGIHPAPGDEINWVDTWIDGVHYLLRSIRRPDYTFVLEGRIKRENGEDEIIAYHEYYEPSESAAFVEQINSQHPLPSFESADQIEEKTKIRVMIFARENYAEDYAYQRTYRPTPQPGYRFDPRAKPITYKRINGMGNEEYIVYTVQNPLSEPELVATLFVERFYYNDEMPLGKVIHTVRAVATVQEQVAPVHIATLQDETLIAPDLQNNFSDGITPQPTPASNFTYLSPSQLLQNERIAYAQDFTLSRSLTDVTLLQSRETPFGEYFKYHFVLENMGKYPIYIGETIHAFVSNYAGERNSDISESISDGNGPILIG